MDPKGCVALPPKVEVEIRLGHVLESPTFKAAPRLAAFLRFVVDATLLGQAEQIKAYTIAVAALGRPDSFDPATDSIVRVEAGRLRRALARYYDNDLTSDTVIIELPLGSYVPQFYWRKSVDATASNMRQVGHAAMPLYLASAVEEAQSAQRRRRDLLAACQLSTQRIRDSIMSMQIELLVSHAITVRSHRLIERSRNGLQTVGD